LVKREDDNQPGALGRIPAISPEALKARSVRLRELRIHRRTDLTLDDLVEWLNPIIAGWMHYYGKCIPFCGASTST